MRGVGEMGRSRWGTSSCPIDMEFLPVITINLRNSDTEWADLNPQSALLQTGLVVTPIFRPMNALVSLVCWSHRLPVTNCLNKPVVK